MSLTEKNVFVSPEFRFQRMYSTKESQNDSEVTKTLVNKGLVYELVPRGQQFKEEQTYRPSWWNALCQRCHQADDTPTWEPTRCRNLCLCVIRMCPTYRQFAQTLCILFCIFLLWGAAYSVFGDLIAPKGQIFSLAFLVISAYLGGHVFFKVLNLPGLIAMLLVGLVYQNVGLVDVKADYTLLNSNLRKAALVVILSRAGLGLDVNIIKKYYVTILKLGLIPWVVECVAIAVATFYVMRLPWLWGFMLGSMVASVSPAVVVPCLLRLRESGYGVTKGIPTLVLAAAAIDDSISIASFGVFHIAVFSNTSLTLTVSKGLISVIVGIFGGAAWGWVASVVPERGDRYTPVLRFLSLTCFGLFAIFGSARIGLGGAGPLAVVSAGFVAAWQWSQQGWPINNNPVCTIFRILWMIFEPLLFSFTGAQIVLNELDPEVVRLGAMCLAGCLTLRIIATFFVGFGCGLNTKEKIFIGITWMAKATVQAALGPAALDSVLSQGMDGSDEDRARGSVLLAVSILSVIMTAPLGAVLIALLGPKLLSKDQEHTEIKHEGNVEDAAVLPAMASSGDIDSTKI